MRRLIAAGIALLLLVPTACSSSSGSHGAPGAGAPASGDTSTAAPASGDTSKAATQAAAAGSCQGDVTATLCVTAAISGAVTVSGAGKAIAPSPPGAGISTTCAQLASDTAGGARNLGDAVTGGIGGHTIGWDVSFAHYTGPGSYPLTAAEFDVTVDYVGYNVTAGATGSITVGPDFATTLMFAHVSSASTNHEISGQISWTCGNPT